MTDGEVLVRRVRLGGRVWWAVAQVTPLPADAQAQKPMLLTLQQALYADPGAVQGRRVPRLEPVPEPR